MCIHPHVSFTDLQSPDATGANIQYPWTNFRRISMASFQRLAKVAQSIRSFSTRHLSTLISWCPDVMSCNVSPPPSYSLLHNFLNFPQTLFYYLQIIFHGTSKSPADVSVINGESCTCLSGQGLTHCVTLSNTSSCFLSYILTSVRCLWSISGILNESSAAQSCF